MDLGDFFINHLLGHGRLAELCLIEHKAVRVLRHNVKLAALALGRQVVPVLADGVKGRLNLSRTDKAAWLEVHFSTHNNVKSIFGFMPYYVPQSATKT